MFLVGNWAPGLQTQDGEEGGVGEGGGCRRGSVEEKLQVVRRRGRPEDMRETPDEGRQVVLFFFLRRSSVSRMRMSGEERQVSEGFSTCLIRNSARVNQLTKSESLNRKCLTSEQVLSFACISGGAWGGGSKTN